jgi:hypothetical protein
MEYEYHNAGNSEAQEKVALSRLFAQAVSGLAATGVLGGLVVIQTTTASGSVVITAGAAVVHSSMTAGASLLVCDSNKTLDIFTANPMGGLPRNDIVVFDSLTASLIAIIGVPNATPTDPTVPNTAIALARLRNLASATTIPTAQIDTLIVPTTLRGVGADPWTAWTPTITGFTVGNGTVAGRYLKSGRNLDLELFITFGSTSAVTGSLSMSLPAGLIMTTEFGLPLRLYAASGSPQPMLAGLCRAGNTSGTGTDLLPYQPTSATNGQLVRIGSVGFSFGTGSTLSFNGTVETTT